jgi:DNA (cytosine-5)-methyltransferase 1
LEWRILNALNFGLPQNRERLFIIGHLKTDAVHPYLAPQNDLSSLSDRVLEKIMNLDTWDSIISQNKKFKSWGLSYQGKFIDAHLDVFSERMKIKKLKDILEDEVREIFDFTPDTIERIKNSIKVDRFYNGVQILYNQKGGARMGYTIFGIEGLAPTLTSTTSRHYERYKVGDKYRRLTNVEYARIQGFPDNHCRSVSIYEQYALYGNAIPPIMAEWVLKRLINEQSTPLKNCQRQLSLF